MPPHQQISDLVDVCCCVRVCCATTHTRCSDCGGLLLRQLIQRDCRKPGGPFACDLCGQLHLFVWVEAQRFETAQLRRDILWFLGFLCRCFKQDRAGFLAAPSLSSGYRLSCLFRCRSPPHLKVFRKLLVSCIQLVKLTTTDAVEQEPDRSSTATVLCIRASPIFASGL